VKVARAIGGTEFVALPQKANVFCPLRQPGLNFSTVCDYENVPGIAFNELWQNAALKKYWIERVCQQNDDRLIG
jgi:hypothetical protein